MYYYNKMVDFTKANMIILFYAILMMITGYIGYKINKKKWI